MRIAIDASNILDGGGITHLTQLLSIYADRNEHTFVLLTADAGPFKDYLRDNITVSIIEAFKGNVFKRNIWLWRSSKKWMEDNNIDILFNPGGGYIGAFRPYVTMCRNMLIFQSDQRKLYGFSKTFFRLKILEFVHNKSIKNASGTIFISEFAKICF